MKKILKTISLLGASAMTMVLASCGGGGDSDKIVIDFWHTFGDKVENSIQNQVDEFERRVKTHEGVDVEIKLTYKGGYDDMPQHITTSLAGGDSPTLAIAYPDHVADYIKAEGNNPGKYVVNLQDFIDNSETTFGTDLYLDDDQGEEDFIEAFIDEGRHYTRDGMYSLPIMKSTEVMIYNRDIVEAALPYYNAEYYHPEHGSDLLPGQLADFINDTMTWDDLMDYAKVIFDNKATIAPSLVVPVMYDSDSNLFITKLYQNEIGYSSIDPTTKQGVIDFETGTARAQAEALVQKWKDEYYRSETNTKPYLLATKGTYGEYGSNLFKAEKTAFTIGSTGGSGYTFPEEGSFNAVVARVPTDNPNKSVYISQGPTLTMLTHPRFSSQKAATLQLYAWKFLKFLTSSEVNVDITCNGSEGYLPVRHSSYTTELFYDFVVNGGEYVQVADIVQNKILGAYINTPVFPGSKTLRDQVGGIVTNALLGTNSITSIFNSAINTTKLDIA